MAAMAIAAVLAVQNTLSAVLLDRRIIDATTEQNDLDLLRGGAAIYATNVIAFGVWYWEMDREHPEVVVSTSHGYSFFCYIER